MRLIDFEPKWVGYGTIIDGLTFLCPCCKGCRLSIRFRPPIDKEGWWSKIVQPSYAGMLVWDRVSGETFDDLTITPSINASSNGHWHGEITNGNLV